jgi:hypothetical protein
MRLSAQYELLLAKPVVDLKIPCVNCRRRIALPKLHSRNVERLTLTVVIESMPPRCSRDSVACGSSSGKEVSIQAPAVAS